MEAQNHEHGKTIEINVDVPERSSITRSKICGAAPYGFSDAGAISKDTKERSASMRKLLIAMALCVVFIIVEVFGG